MTDPWIENVASAGVTVLALVLALIALRAWIYSRSPKVLFLALGFVLFLAKGVWVSVALFTRADWADAVVLPSLILDLLILGALYVGVLRRGAG